MTRQEALELVREYTKNENLVKHMLAVEAAMAAYYQKFEDGPSSVHRSSARFESEGAQSLAPKEVEDSEEEWRICGILHDFDYEKMGPDHPSEWGHEILLEKGVGENVIDAIKGHAERNNPASRPTLMAKTLFAVDELTGFIVACALVHPDKLSGLTAESVFKKFKKKDFAKGVSREDIYQGAKELNVDVINHVRTVLDAMIGIREELGL